jgi:predicted RNA-binding Zn ribbon-like protein
VSNVTKRPDLPHRIAGNLALDLANTISWRGTEREVDHLGDADAIIAWALDAGLVDSGFMVSASGRTKLVNDVHDLRGAIDDAGAAIADGDAPPAKALNVIHEYAARSFAAAALTGASASIGPPLYQWRADCSCRMVAWNAVSKAAGLL